MVLILSLNFFDKIFYINLSHRKDRKESIETQLKDLGVDVSRVVRVEAHHDVLNGHKGCALSHVKALQQAKALNISNALILEDDMVFEKSKETIDNYIEEFFQSFSNEWDVFFLATNVFEYLDTGHANYKAVKKSLCAHAYAVNHCYLDTLIDCFETAAKLMVEDELFTGAMHKAIDRAWHKLQGKDRWFIGKEPLGHQGASYSDIEHIVRDRKHQTFLP